MIQTMPADIAAAIDALEWGAEACGQSGIIHDEAKLAQAQHVVASARAALDTVILKHLHRTEALCELARNDADLIGIA